MAGDKEKIELDPDSAAAYINRGRSYYELGQYQRAIEDFDKAIELDPLDWEENNALVYGSRGDAYSALGNITQAEADFAKACSLDSQLC